MKQSIEQKILERQVALENALNYPDILKKLASFSYDRKKLLEGKALNEKVRLLQLAKQDKYGSQYASTDVLESNWAEAKAIYSKHVLFARVAYQGDRGMQQKLQINGARKTDRAKWLAQAMAFYSKIDEIGEAMTQYGVSLEVLQQTKAMVEALATTREQQLQRKAEAQDATEQRDAALKAMDTWMKEFRTIARFALKDHPQWLEMLGIKMVNQVK